MAQGENEINRSGDAILARCGAGWSSIFRELAARNETDLLRILRPHEKVAVHYDDDAAELALRDRLDESLDTLSLLELGASIGALQISQLEQVFDGKQNGEPVPRILFESAAFRRYLNYYLYFGVRCLAGRVFAGVSPPKDAPAPTLNIVPVALRYPPVPPNQQEHLTNAHVGSFLILTAMDLMPGPMFDALRFLDDHIAEIRPKEKTEFYLWLRGLWHGEAARLEALTTGITDWVRRRVAFYRSVEGANGETINRSWMARNPLTARFGLVDLYWLARLLRAEVSETGRVRYSEKSWLDQIAFHAEYRGEPALARELLEAETVLRGVFDYACDLIQNAIELTELEELWLRTPGEFPRPSESEAAGWRQTFDEELDEIHQQRRSRTLPGPVKPFGDGMAEGEGQWWSRRVLTGEYPHDDMVGLAISGGGIRSATFGLGVLEGLQEFDLLRYVDYLSTVSGGGYIGSWLLGNVSRTSHWLGRRMNWEDSIAHLRRHAQYLAPKTGIFSADSWTMGGIWLRNALLIQLTAFTWLLLFLTLCLTGKRTFLRVGDHEDAARLLATTLLAVAAVAIGWNLHRTDAVGGKPCFRETTILLGVVAPAWIAAYLTAGLMWGDATGQTSIATLFAGVDTFSGILTTAFQPWLVLLLPMFVLFTFLAILTMSAHVVRQGKSLGKALLRVLPEAVLICGPLATGGLYLQLCAVFWLFRHWAENADRYVWYAVVLGPTMVLISSTIAVVLFIGLCGRLTSEFSREWWTRMGSWLFMSGAAYLVLAVAAVFGPWWILSLFDVHWTVTWTTVGGFVGTVISGLFAGKSDKTAGNRGGAKELLARIGAIAFIAGGLLGVSTILYMFLVNVSTEHLTPEARTYWYGLSQLDWTWVRLTAAATALVGVLLSWRVELNTFSLNHFYRNRLVRCYLGATRWRPGMRSPNPFTGFDSNDDIHLPDLRTTNRVRSFRGPFPIVNCTLNLGGSDDLSVVTRQSASFSMTPWRCGSDRKRVGYAPAKDFAGGISLGQAVAVSGAAASPNMGYSTSALVSFLLTIFNVRLGWWFPNPSLSTWKQNKMPARGFFYLILELFGIAGEKRGYLNVSDGGHFENLGIYELVRRRVKVIIASDAECDPELEFGSLGNLIRICETDFGAKIEIDVNSIRKQSNGRSLAHCAVGRITYSNGSQGWLIYLKSSIAGDEDVSISQYKAGHPTFPHESTGDQFFTEDQFESYRRLGRHIVMHAFRGTGVGERLPRAAERMFDTWTPARFSSDSFLRHTRTLEEMWEKFRLSEDLHPLLQELTSTHPVPPRAPVVMSEGELCVCLELTQLMENVFVDLRLDDFWSHPDNRGWAMLFSGWARSPVFREAWRQTRRTFGIRFEYFCEERLGLARERPVARV